MFAYIALAGAILISFLRTLNGGMLFDDEYIKLMTERTTFTRPFYELWAPLWGSFRPMTHTSYRWTWRIFGFDLRAFHAVNILLHLWNTWMVFLLLEPFLHFERAMIGAAVFALHPLQAWVSYITSRADLLSAAFAYSGLLFAGRGQWGLMLLSFVLSQKSKEIGVFYALFAPMVGYLHGSISGITALLYSGLVAGLILTYALYRGFSQKRSMTRFLNIAPMA